LKAGKNSDVTIGTKEIKGRQSAGGEKNATQPDNKKYAEHTKRVTITTDMKNINQANKEMG
jgi:hypothetical protein